MNLDEMISTIQDNYSDEEIAEYNQYVLSLNEKNIDELPEKPIEGTAVEQVTEPNSEQVLEELQVAEIEETPQLETPTKENFIVRTVRKSYDKKSKKANLKVKSIECQIKNNQAEILNLENAISNLNEKCKEKSGEIIGLINANTFLETQIDGGIIGKILKFTISVNEKKIRKLKTEIDGFERKIKNHADAIKSKSDNISALQNSLPNKQSDVLKIEEKKNNLEKISTFSNPIAALFINNKNPKVMANLEKYCYKKVSEEELKKLKEGFDGTFKRKGNVVIVRFLRSDLGEYENCLNGGVC